MSPVEASAPRCGDGSEEGPPAVIVVLCRVEEETDVGGDIAIVDRKGRGRNGGRGEGTENASSGVEWSAGEVWAMVGGRVEEENTGTMLAAVTDMALITKLDG